MSTTEPFAFVAAVYLSAFAGVFLLVLIVFAVIERVIDAGARRGWWHRRI